MLFSVVHWLFDMIRNEKSIDRQIYLFDMVFNETKLLFVKRRFKKHIIDYESQML
jgi:hypothetical protein